MCKIRSLDRCMARDPRDGPLRNSKMNETIRLTTTQALVRYVAALRADTGHGVMPLFGGVFAIFGHGNVAGRGEGLCRHRDELPTYRAHNERAMTLALPQDVQTMAYDFPRDFFAPSTIVFRAPPPAPTEVARAAAVLREAKQPMLIAGGGVLYGLAGSALRAFANKHGVPVAETQAGKGALPWDHPLQLGAIGVTGSPAANSLARAADVVLAVGTRLQDFTTGSHSLFAQAKLVNLNVNAFDALKWRSVELIADAKPGLAQ